jgi:hypothetical protein
MAYQTIPGGGTIPAAAGDTRSPHYQDLKAKVHQELLNRLNLDRLNKVSRREAEPEIRELINHLIESEVQKTPLSLFERENLIIDVLDELFGLGPLEALLKDRDISDILVNRHDQVFIERNGMLEETGITFKDDRWTRGSPTARASTRSSRPWRSTARRSRFAGSARIASARRISSSGCRSRSRCWTS